MADICTVYMYPFHSFHCSSSEKSLYSISVDTILNTYCLHYRLYSSKSHIFWRDLVIINPGRISGLQNPQSRIPELGKLARIAIPIDLYTNVLHVF